MTVEYSYRSDWKCALLRASGERRVEEYRQLVLALKADPNIQPPYLRLTDLRAVTTTPTPDFARTMANIMRDLETTKPSTRGAILVNESVKFGMIRLYLAHLDDPQNKLGVFREFTDAVRWLGLPEDAPDPFATDQWTADWSYTPP